MGAGMEKVLPGLYLGSKIDSEDKEQIEKNKITHILSIHDDAREGKFKVWNFYWNESSLGIILLYLQKKIKYLCIQASDYEYQDLSHYFSNTIDFIHKARLEGGNVLVHWYGKYHIFFYHFTFLWVFWIYSMAGVSRSTTIVIAYVMTVTDTPWLDAMNAVRGARKITNPNLGFQKQLYGFNEKGVIKVIYFLKFFFVKSFLMKWNPVGDKLLRYH